MSKIGNAIREEKGTRRYVGWTKLQATVDTEEKPTGLINGFAELTDYHTEIRLAVTTRCNDLQWKHNQREFAKKRLLDEIYSEVRGHIHRAIVAAYGNDLEETIDCLQEALSATED